MPLNVELYALVAEDVEQMVACFHPMGFASSHVDKPVVPAQAREWLASCAPLLKRLGNRGSEELMTGIARLRERWPGYELEPGDTDKMRQFGVNLNVHLLFQRLAAEYLAKATRPHAVRSFILQGDVTWECFERTHFDGEPLVPTWGAVHHPAKGHAFASCPVTHSPFGRYYLWRGASEVRAFFQTPEDTLLAPPPPEQVLAFNQKQGHWHSASDPLESARSAIRATRENWSTLVDVLRTAARFNGAFISTSQDVTDYE